MVAGSVTRVVVSVTMAVVSVTMVAGSVTNGPVLGNVRHNCKVGPEW
jgi:hypothetical protein